MKKQCCPRDHDGNCDKHPEEKPLLFRAPMVRAIREDRKTQTRRLMKFEHAGCGSACHPAVEAITHRGDGWWGFDAPEERKQQYITTFPFGTIRCPHPVGSRIWTKETFQVHPCTIVGELIIYRADGYGSDACCADCDERYGKWKPSIFMPRVASRDLLEVTEVRVQRLQEISKADVIAEGTPGFELEKCSEEEARACYRGLWDSINGKGSWDENPFLWVYTFKRI